MKRSVLVSADHQLVLKHWPHDSGLTASPLRAMVGAMDARRTPALAEWLATPDPVDGLIALAETWRDVDCRVVLAPVGPADGRFGAHLRRSFLAALGPGASAAAQAGQPCPWDPPCALDVFLREQLRAGGDGLPKPYVLFWQQQGQVMETTLRIFGTACDWGAAASEAIVAAMSALPWSKALHSAPPQVLNRSISPAPWTEVPEGPLTLRLVSPMDAEGAKPGDTRDIATRILSRALRRVDALARWHGLALEAAALRALTAQAGEVRAIATRLSPGQHASPNRHGEKRVSRTLIGEIDLPPLSPDMRMLLALACRCHIGRHTNEGLGVVRVDAASFRSA